MYMKKGVIFGEEGIKSTAYFVESTFTWASIYICSYFSPHLLSLNKLLEIEYVYICFILNKFSINLFCHVPVHFLFHIDI